MSDIIHVTDKSFEEDVIQSDKPVLVDFWTEWCGPCKMIAPILDEIAKKFEGQIKVAKVDVDSNSDTATNYGVRGIPTLMLFKNGTLIDTKVGATPKNDLIEWITANI